MITTERTSARERLLAAADELFYEEGIHTVGIDRVIERAGVAKASLYNTFGSKDELVRAYLHERHVRRQARVDRRLAMVSDPRDRVLAVFDALGDAIAASGYHGCAFVNASAEASSESPVALVVDEYRGWVRALFTKLAAEAGAGDPPGLARQLVLLYDGAAISARNDRCDDAAVVARSAAAVLLDAAVAG